MRPCANVRNRPSCCWPTRAPPPPAAGGGGRPGGAPPPPPAGVSLDWELLAQGAQAIKDDELLALSKQCHPQTLRQMRWANAMLKELSPQALAG